MTIFGGAEPWLLALLAASAILYAVGIARLWASAGRGRGIRRGEALRFALAWLVLCAAIASPLDDLADRLFCAHMVEHELLMAVAAPLFAISRPLGAFLRALPISWARALRTGAGTTAIRGLWRHLMAP